jgi:curved DNA-binding protein
MQFKDYYETLGVAPTATEAEIKTAYRRLARKYHPDVSKEGGAEDKFKAINEAHEALRDPQKRAAYDQLRARGYRAGQEFHPPPGYGGGGRHAQDFEFDLGEAFGGAESGGGGFSDFFESLFGQQARARGARTHGGPRSAPRAPAAERARIEIDLETAYAGGMQRLAIDGRTIDLRIPKGTASGQQMRLSGQGRGGGDLLLDVGFRPHPQFEVDGRDVRLTLPLTPWQAALGAELSVPTLGGTVQLRIPPGSDTGKRLRLRGRGLPSPQGDAAGDQFVVLEVHAPAAETDRQRELYAELAAAFGAGDAAP